MSSFPNGRLVVCALISSLMLGISFTPSHAINRDDVTPMGYHLSGVSYFVAPYYANAFYNASDWQSLKPGLVEDKNGDLVDGTIKTTLYRWDLNNQLNPRFNEQGYPRYLEPDERLRTNVLLLRGQSGKPVTWPDRNEPVRGRVVLSWKGTADLRLWQGNLVSSEPALFDHQGNPTDEGMLTNGTRVYNLSGNDQIALIVEALPFAAPHNQPDPITEIKIWLPDPEGDPSTDTLDGTKHAGFYPILMDRLGDRDWNAIRFMSFSETNDSPVKTWDERRKPDDSTMIGTLSRRDPRTGEFRTVLPGPKFNYPDTGPAYEHMIALANEANKDLWINVPHLADDQFITNLAKLIANGSNGILPYASPNADPTYPPLNSNLKVYVEYSNEVWNRQFDQHHYVNNVVRKPDNTFEQALAERFSRTWELFEAAGLSRNRVIRVVATQGSNDGYTEKLLDAFYESELGGDNLLKPEVLSPATYFGNGIQHWVWDNKNLFQMPWGEDAEKDDYWTTGSPNPDEDQRLYEDLDVMFKQWNQWVLSGFAYGNNNDLDDVSKKGGLADRIAELGAERGLEVIAYEGGASIYTDKLDNSNDGKTSTNSITNFIIEATRDPRYAPIYTIHLNQARERGAVSNMLFSDVTNWGKNGQWGHLEYLDQDPSTAVKYQTALRHFDEMADFNHPDDPNGGVPVFDLPADLPPVFVGDSVGPHVVSVSDSAGGNGPFVMEELGAHGININGATEASITYDYGSGDWGTIDGTATTSGTVFLYLRVHDLDGDVAWRNYNIPIIEPTTLPEVVFDFDTVKPLNQLPLFNLPPLQIGDYVFATSSQNGTGNGLSIFTDEDLRNNPDPKAPAPSLGWGSPVLGQRIANGAIVIEQEEGEIFDLHRFDVGSEVFASVKITVVYPDGNSRSVIGDITGGTSMQTTLEPKLQGGIRYTIEGHERVDGAKKHFYFAIDDLVLNGIDSAPPPPTGNQLTLDFDELDGLLSLPSSERDLDLVESKGFRIECFTHSQAQRTLHVYDGPEGAALRPRGWRMKLVLTRIDGQPFDLLGFEHGAASNTTDQLLNVTGLDANGGVVGNLVELSNDATDSLLPQNLNWPGVTSVVFDWKVDGAGRYGIIDNIKIRQ